MQSFWKLESLGISFKDHKAVTGFDSSITFKEGRYEVGLPWKDPHPPLTNNHNLCSKRLHGLMRHLKQQPCILKKYNATIQLQLQKGIVEVVDDPEESSNGRVHYLPHHPVIRKDKETTKLRIVYDASARAVGASLNDCLYTGPKYDQ